MSSSSCELSVILTAYKRDYFEEQIQAILNQTLSIPPSNIYLWQNEQHIDVTKYREKYGIKVVRSDENFSFYSRFVFAHLMKTEYVVILDDDIIPGKKWLENSLHLCKTKNCIVGANGRSWNQYTNKYDGFGDHQLYREMKVDFVGHSWLFKKKWLQYLWMIEPYTYDNGEDMHFCYCAKHFGNIDSYICGRSTLDECADLTNNRYGTDELASCKTKQNFRNCRNEIAIYLRNKSMTM
tara:strand:- start:532 stop:1245 length:714 start_codon:yes stop_codon:yes gene_type:complete